MICMKGKILPSLMSMFLALAFIVSSCSDDDTEDTCTLELDKDCFCDANPDDAECFVACEMEASEVFIQGTSTNNEYVPMEDGDLLNEFILRYEVGGEDLAFKFFNSDDGVDGNWGAAVGRSSEASGTAEPSINGSTCGNENEAFSIDNSDAKEIAEVTLNTETGAYDVAFDDRNPCVEHDLVTNKLWLKGNVAYFNETGDLVVTWNGGVAGIPMVQSDDDPDVYTALVEHYPAWAGFIDFKVVLNPEGDYGSSAGEGGIAVDFGPGVSEEPITDLEGIFYIKAFEVSFDENDNKVETILDCTNAPPHPNPDIPGDTTPNTGAWKVDFPGGNDPANQVPALVTFNLKTRAYKVEFQN